MTDWAAYFAENAANQMPIDWACHYRLTEAEIGCVLRSIQQFQLGESSEGVHLIQRAERYAQHRQDTAYLPALRAFIAEEQRHAAYLARFLRQQNLPLIEHNWVDSVFRRLRRLATLEVSVVVLITAEIIAVTYYKALHDVTQSLTLQHICRQILHDEIKHLAFQRQTLDQLRVRRSRVMCGLGMRLHRLLFAGTLLIVWWQHGKVYRAAGSNLFNFWQRNWTRFNHTFA
ncbi:MAG: hypothetical protein OHK0023_03710 [Anaerolineae bacterium]